MRYVWLFLLSLLSSPIVFASDPSIDRSTTVISNQVLEIIKDYKGEQYSPPYIPPAIAIVEDTPITEIKKRTIRDELFIFPEKPAAPKSPPSLKPAKEKEEERGDVSAVLERAASEHTMDVEKSEFMKNLLLRLGYPKVGKDGIKKKLAALQSQLDDPEEAKSVSSDLLILETLMHLEALKSLSPGDAEELLSSLPKFES